MYHEMSYRVPYADTDQMGVVYYANYLEYFERSRTELLREAGLPYSELERQGVYLPVTEVQLKYLAPAHYDELLTFRSWIQELKVVRLWVASEVRLGDRVLVSGVVTLGCVDGSRHPRRLPPELIACGRKFNGEEAQK